MHGFAKRHAFKRVITFSYSTSKKATLKAQISHVAKETILRSNALNQHS
jgi:hypothetical protein